MLPVERRSLRIPSSLSPSHRQDNVFIGQEEYMA